VISVGNLEAGGTGKTPLVAWIANSALKKGISVTILSRGYLSESEGTGAIISPGTAQADPRLVGDEPALLHELTPQAWIGVGSDRRLAYQRVMEQRGGPSDWIILDDGYQHLKIKRDVEILTLTSRTPSQAFFRESPRRKIPASVLTVWTKGSRDPKISGRSSDVVLEFYPKVRFGEPPQAGEAFFLITSVANGANVREQIEALGHPIREHQILSDHSEINNVLVQDVLEKSKGWGVRIAMTGKDWVKWRLFKTAGEQIIVFESELKFKSGLAKLESALWGS
jgi:tetraacyldisaccharide 4'-kinase